MNNAKKILTQTVISMTLKSPSACACCNEFDVMIHAISELCSSIKVVHNEFCIISNQSGCKEKAEQTKARQAKQSKAKQSTAKKKH